MSIPINRDEPTPGEAVASTSEAFSLDRFNFEKLIAENGGLQGLRPAEVRRMVSVGVTYVLAGATTAQDVASARQALILERRTRAADNPSDIDVEKAARLPDVVAWTLLLALIVSIREDAIEGGR